MHGQGLQHSVSHRDNRAEAARLLHGISGLLEAVEQRVTELPEYRLWLEQYGHEVLMEWEEWRMNAPGQKSASHLEDESAPTK
jgi:hypothetical protein